MSKLVKATVTAIATLIMFVGDAKAVKTVSLQGSETLLEMVAAEVGAYMKNIVIRLYRLQVADRAQVSTHC